jgi:hypothetical protein
MFRAGIGFFILALVVCLSNFLFPGAEVPVQKLIASAAASLCLAIIGAAMLIVDALDGIAKKGKQ